MGSDDGAAASQQLLKDQLGYSDLKDFRLEIDQKDTTFTLCFWVYLLNSTPVPSTILHQGNSDIKHSTPFLVLNEEKKLNLFSPCSLYKEISDCVNSASTISCSSEEEIPLGKWIHIGCGASSSFIRLHIDGKIVAEKYFDSMPVEESEYANCRRVIFSFVGQENGEKGYIHGAMILPVSKTVHNHHTEDPPLQLSISSPVSGIEEESEDAWSIVYGKESCRNNFCVDVLLVDAFGELVHKEMEVAASLIYPDDQACAKKPDDAESPLLISSDGIEFSCPNVCSKLTHGRTTFKFKISQKLSRCDNRVFRLKFSITKMGIHPFLEMISPPVHCVSRNLETGTSAITWKKLPSGVHLVNGSNSSGQSNVYNELQLNGACQAISNPPSKRVKIGPHGTPELMEIDQIQEHQDEECDSHVRQASKEDFGETENRASDSESVGAGTVSKNKLHTEDIMSDLTIFRYCLGSLSDRSGFLKEVMPFASDEQLADFAERIYHYSGCSRHRHQILIAKRLFEEGERAWNSISQNNPRVNLENVVFEIEEHFMKISCCHTRSLTQQDMNFLRRISGCNEYMTRENFDKMWRWLYPVASTISHDGINGLWASTAPKWIEGFFTKEEVEFALQSPMSIQGPGTFILRFPTSRSWPHPDAGSLVVTYVSGDYALRHRVLSLDYSCGKHGAQTKALQELLLAEPELSRLARIRS